MEHGKARNATAAVTALFEISAAITGTDNLDDLYAAIHGSLNKVLPLENFAIALYHEEKDSITFPYFVDEIDENPGEIFNISKMQSLTARVIQAGKPLIFNEEDIRELVAGPAEMRIGSISKAWIGAPLKIRGRTFGALIVQSYRSKDAFYPTDLGFLNSVAEFIAVSIERKQIDMARRQSDEINQALRDISSAVHSSGSLSRLFEKIHQTLGRILDVSNFYIGLYDKETNNISFPFFRDEYDVVTIWDASDLKTNSLTYKVFQALKPVLFKKEELDILAEKKQLLGTVPLVWLGIPLMTKTEPIGLMVVQSYSDPNLFDQKDVDILCSVSEQIAVAIERKRADEKLRESEEKYRTLFDTMPNGFYLSSPSGYIIDANPAFFKMLGYESLDELRKVYIPTDLYADQAERNHADTRSEQAHQSETYRLRRKDGETIWVEDNARYIRNSDGTVRYHQGICRDITWRKQAEEELYRISIHDHLTDIYNRRYIFERLDALAEEDQRNGRKFSLIIIDLDFFKKINDTHGHQAGDFILKEFASILSGSFRPYDLVGRYGGEEFIVVAMNIDIPRTRKMFLRLRNTIKARVFDFNGTPLKITFSAGMVNTCEPDLEKTVEHLIRKADQRLYLAKARGRDRLVSE